MESEPPCSIGLYTARYDNVIWDCQYALVILDRGFDIINNMICDIMCTAVQSQGTNTMQHISCYIIVNTNKNSK